MNVLDPTAEPARLPLNEDNPWAGLDSYHEFDREYFKGRAADQTDLFERVQNAQVTVLYGNSGTGKSSLLEAGLFPLLRKANALPIRVRFDFSGQGKDMVEQVKEAIRLQAAEWKVETPPLGPELTLWECFHSRNHQFWDPLNRIVLPVLVFDQFEEVFTLGIEPPGRKRATDAFLSQFVDLVRGRVPEALESRLQLPEVTLHEASDRGLQFDTRRHHYRILISLRQDYLANLNKLRDQMPEIVLNQRDLAQMDGTMALEVVNQAVPHLMSAETAEKVVRFVAKAEDVSLKDATADPALLSVFCSELNEKRRKRGDARIEPDLLTGSSEKILQEFYERAMADVSTPMRTFVEESLIQDSGYANRAYRYAVGLLVALNQPGIKREEFNKLVERRLLRLEPRHGVTWVELTHDLLVSVVRESRDQRRAMVADELARVADELARKDAEEAAASALKQAQEEAENARKEAAEAAERAREEEREAAEKARKEAERAAEELRNTIILVALAVFAVMSVLLGAAAYQLLQESRQQFAKDEIQKAAQNLAAGRPTEALAYAAHALRSDPASLTARQMLTAVMLRGWVSKVIFHHGDAVRSVAFSPNGKWVVTASDDDTAQLWEADGGRSLQRLQHHGAVTDVAVSSDSRLIATASEDGTAGIWETPTGKNLRLLSPVGGSVPVNSVMFGHHNGRLVTASGDGTLQVWETTSGERVLPPFRADANLSIPARSAAFSPDDQWILATSDDGTVRLLEAKTGTEAPQFHHEGPVHQGAVQDGRFSPDGRWFATAGVDGVAQVWDVRTGQPVGKRLRHPGGPGSPSESGPPISRVAFSPNGELLVTAAADGTARVWVAATGDPFTGLTRQQVVLRHRTAITDVAFSNDGKRVVTASEDQTAGVWDVDTGQPIGFLGHQGSVYRAVFSPDHESKWIVTASADNSARVWDAAGDKDQKAPLGDALKPLSVNALIHTADLSSNGTMMAIASGNSAKLWEVGSSPDNLKDLPHGSWVNSARLGHHDKWVVTASADKTAQVWDVQSARRLSPPLQHRSAVTDAAFSPDGKLVVTGSQDKTAQVWDAATGQKVGPTLKHPAAVTIVRFSHDGKLLITAAEDRTARVWEAATGQQVGQALRHAGVITTAEFSPKDERVVTASVDGSAKVWEGRTGTKLQVLHRAGPVRSASFSPDGTRIVTASDDFTAQVWDVKTGRGVGLALQHQAPVLSAAFNTDGRRVVTASVDGTAQVWDAEAGLPVGPPLNHHGKRVFWAAFSENPHWVMTASGGVADAEVTPWFMQIGNSETPFLAGITPFMRQSRMLGDDPLVVLADVISGYIVKNGILTPLEDVATQRSRLKEKVKNANGQESNSADFVKNYLKLH